MLRGLKTALNNALDFNEEDLADLGASEIVSLAETYCSLTFTPDTILEAAIQTPAHYSDEAIDLFVEGSAELDAYIDQFKVGQVLAEAYQHGDQELQLTPDQIKREKFGRFSQEAKKEESAENESLSLDKKLHRLGKKTQEVLGLSTIQAARDKLTWFTRLRLGFGVRLNRVLALSNHGFLKKIGIVAGIASLSYFIDLFLLMWKAVDAAFFPTIEQEKRTPRRWDRFLNVFRQGYFLLDVCNALWGLVNLIGLFASAGVTAAFNLGFFHRDFFEDVYKFYRDQKNCNVLMKKIVLKEKKYEEEMSHLNSLGELSSEQLKRKEELYLDMAKLQRVKERLSEAKKTNRNMRLWLLATTTLILVGMIVILVPQIAAVAALAGFTAKLAGSYLALSGSVFNRAFIMKVIESHPIQKMCELFGRKKSPPLKKLEPKVNSESWRNLKKIRTDLFLNGRKPELNDVRQYAKEGRHVTSFFQFPPPGLRSIQSEPIIKENSIESVTRSRSAPLVRLPSGPIPIKQAHSRSRSVMFRSSVEGIVECSPPVAEKMGLSFIDESSEPWSLSHSNSR